MTDKNGTLRLVDEVELLRIRVAAAESKLKVLREQARLARHRRKEAKRLAQHARTLYKRGKADVAEVKQSLAKAEVKLFRAGGRAMARKIGKARRVEKSSARPSKKPSVTVRNPRPVSAAASVSGRGFRETPAIMSPTPIPSGYAPAGVHESERSTRSIPITRTTTL